MGQAMVQVIQAEGGFLASNLNVVTESLKYCVVMVLMAIICFQDALATAHSSRHRPLCLCRPEGLQMYVARIGSGFILKRMPDTGAAHAPDCLSYEPPAGLSGLGELKGSAIVEDPTLGTTALKLGFALTRGNGRSSMPANGAVTTVSRATARSSRCAACCTTSGTRPRLTRWQPGFAGRRSWAVIRKHLLQAAEGKVARGRSLQDQLYIPEPFSVERRDDIHARRIAHWSQAAKPGQRGRLLLLLIGEVKEITPARFGYKAVIKHLPDQAFLLDETLYRRWQGGSNPSCLTEFERRFAHGCDGYVWGWGRPRACHR